MTPLSPTRRRDPAAAGRPPGGTDADRLVDRLVDDMTRRWQAGDHALTGDHLALARLQHTHVVPLYSVHDDPARRLRALCMPYFGGAALDRVLAALPDRPPGRRTGRHLLDALRRAQDDLPPAEPAGGPAP